MPSPASTPEPRSAPDDVAQRSHLARLIGDPGSQPRDVVRRIDIRRPVAGPRGVDGYRCRQRPSRGDRVAAAPPGTSARRRWARVSRRSGPRWREPRGRSARSGPIGLGCDAQEMRRRCVPGRGDRRGRGDRQHPASMGSGSMRPSGGHESCSARRSGQRQRVSRALGGELDGRLRPAPARSPTAVLAAADRPFGTGHRPGPPPFRQGTRSVVQASSRHQREVTTHCPGLPGRNSVGRTG